MTRRRIPYVAQVELADCGAAALAMVLGFFGRNISLQEVQVLTGTGRDGVTALGLVEAATHYGLRARGVATELSDLRDMPAGTVLHWGDQHFVVLDRTGPRGVTLVDPAAGRYRVRWAQAGEHYSGVAILLEPGDAFRAGGVRRRGIWPHLRRLVSRSTGFGRIIAVSVLLRIAALAVPALTGAVVDRVVPSGDDRLVAVLFAVMIGLVGYEFAATFLRAHLLLRLRTALDVDMTMGFLEHLVALPYGFFLKRSSGDLMMRLRSNATVREILTTGALSSLLDGGLAVFYLVAILAAAPQLGLLALGLGAAQVAVLIAARRRNQHLMGEALHTEARSQSYAYEMLSAMETLKAAGAERRAVSHWSNLFAEEITVSVRRGGLAALVEAASAALQLLSPAAVLLVGATLVLNGQLTLGAMLALAALAAGFLHPLAGLVATGMEIQLLGSYLARINDVLDTPTETAGRTVRPARRLHGQLRAEHLTFRYTPLGPPVIDDVTVTVHPGQLVAIVGRSGSGKSTLGRLLLGLYPPHSGRVLVDGMDLQLLDPATVRSQIGVVTQEPYVFGQTVRENITLTNPGLELGRVVAAARLAGIADDIEAMPMAWDTPIVDGGASLSGGQRQRLVLARALAGEPRLMLLDEATSHLDTITETHVHANLARIGCTTIVIAHRLSTVIDADQILVMDAGRLVERGTHTELMRRGGRYTDLARGQLQADLDHTVRMLSRTSAPRFRTEGR